MGVKPNEIQFFTVPDTGVRLPYRKVAPALLTEMERSLRAEMPAPTAPKQKVDYGSGPEWEENLAHPGYQAALEEHKGRFNMELTTRTQKLLLRRGVLPYLTLSEEQQAEVEALRAEMRDEYGMELDPNDKWVYVNMIALGTVEDIGDMTSALIRRTTVTEEAVNESLRKF